MNKRQRKKQEQKCAAARYPWAYGSSALPPDDREEVYVVYVPSCPAVDDEYRNDEVLVTPCTSGPDSVIACCREIVDDFLAGRYHQGVTSNDLFTDYRHHGPDPFVLYEKRDSRGGHYTTSQPATFNAWAYAEIACRRMCGEEPGEPSRSLALWQGRYREFDRKRMAAQLLLWRGVRLTRECLGMIGTFAKGTEGFVGMHSSSVGASCFDWSVELPVTFAVDDTRGRVTFGVPYDAMEFVESEAAFIEKLSDAVVKMLGAINY